MSSALAQPLSPLLQTGLEGNPIRMATRTPLRDYERSRPEPSHGLLERAEEWEIGRAHV